MPKFEANKDDFAKIWQKLGAIAPQLRRLLGDSVLLIPRDFWFGAILGVGLGGLAVLLGALGWYPSAWGLMRGRGTAVIWGFPARNI